MVKERFDVKPDFIGLGSALDKHFKTLTDGRRSKILAFYNRKQMSGESVVKYIGALENLAQLIYPGTDNPMPPSQFVERFLHGMTCSNEWWY